MVLPVAETIEKQLMVVLRDRQKDLTEFLGIKLLLATMSSIYGEARHRLANTVNPIKVHESAQT